MSGEGSLLEKLLENRVNLDNYPKVKEVLSLFDKGRIKRVDTTNKIKIYLFTCIAHDLFIP